MKLPSLKTIVLTPIIAFFIFYAVGVVMLQMRDEVKLHAPPPLSQPLEIAIFGASGTAGDGILKAALASATIEKIHIMTRRVTPRIQQGIDAGKVKMLLHLDYLDYSKVIDQLSEVDAVFWAIGISAMGADEETYGMIHVDFPMQFVGEFIGVASKPSPSFHFISSSDISEDSTTMWVRQKIRAEKSLFELAEKSKLRVIAYRPDYIGATEEEAHLGQKLLYWFFRPVGAAVQAQEIGRAMIDVTLRGEEFANGSKLGTGKIIRHSK